MKKSTSIFRKLGLFYRQKLTEFRTRKSFQKVERATKKLREERKTDLLRWEKENELLADWNERTALISSMIPKDSKILEFGAGSMWLKSHLPEGCSYTGTDIVEREPGMLICDLNKPIEIDMKPFDTAVFSGVLEYVFDIRQLFHQLKDHFRHVFLSYACSDICNMNRLNKGWLSDYTLEELKRIFSETGYEIVERKEWRSQVILQLRRV